MPIVIVDTEYTTWPGALESGWAGPGQHREIVQIAAIKVSDDFTEITAFDELVLPRHNPQLSPLFTELTSISQEALEARGKSFAVQQQAFQAFCGAPTLPIICMNADEAVFRENCRLNDVVFPFSASWHRLRPFLEAQGVDLTHLSSGGLHKLTPTPLPEGHTHYALHDVRSMACWLRHARQTGHLTTLSQLPTGAPKTDPRSIRPCGP